jgi:hypothetical protein
MAVYVSCCNVQSKSRSDPLDISRYLYSINCPTVICLPSMCFLSYGETPLVNCGTRSYFLYIAITCLLYSHTTIAFHSICSFLCLQQTGEIDNLIVSWEQSIWLCCVHVPRCSWQSKALDEAPYKLSRAVARLASITFLSLAFSWIRQTLVSYWGKSLLLYSSYLPLGVPNWTVIYIINRAASTNLTSKPFVYMLWLFVSTGRAKDFIRSRIRTRTNGVRVPAIVFDYLRHSGATDEGMTCGSLILAYLVFGPRRVSTEGIERPTKMIARRGPGARLNVQGKNSRRPSWIRARIGFIQIDSICTCLEDNPGTQPLPIKGWEGDPVAARHFSPSNTRALEFSRALHLRLDPIYAIAITPPL